MPVEASPGESAHVLSSVVTSHVHGCEWLLLVGYRRIANDLPLGSSCVLAGEAEPASNVGKRFG